MILAEDFAPYSASDLAKERTLVASREAATHIGRLMATIRKYDAIATQLTSELDEARRVARVLAKPDGDCCFKKACEHEFCNALRAVSAYPEVK